jgi:hypothetical protein
MGLNATASKNQNPLEAVMYMHIRLLRNGALRITRREDDKDQDYT